MGSVVSKVEVGKPCDERGLQKLDVPDRRLQLVQPPLPFRYLAAEQILIMVILRIAREILIGIIAQCYCRSSQRVIDA